MTRVKVTQATKLDFGRDEHGGIAIMFAAMLMAIALMIGVGIDTSRLMLTRRTMQDAVDGASLAAVKILVAEGGTPQAVADAIATGTAYFNANIASVRNTVSSIPAPVIVPDANTSTVVVTSRRASSTPQARA